MTRGTRPYYVPVGNEEQVFRAAFRQGLSVLLKGPTTLVGEPGGFVRAVTTGDQRLATAGTGDVLSGTIGALLASGMAPFDAAAAGAWVHATAASLQAAAGLVASDVAAAIPRAIELTTTCRCERAPVNVQPNGHCVGGQRHE